MTQCLHKTGHPHDSCRIGFMISDDCRKELPMSVFIENLQNHIILGWNKLEMQVDKILQNINDIKEKVTDL